MLNPNIEIKKWFYTNLTSASGLVVYDGFAPEGAGDEYIVMTGRTSSQDQGKAVAAIMNAINKAREDFNRQSVLYDYKKVA